MCQSARSNGVSRKRGGSSGGAFAHADIAMWDESDLDRQIDDAARELTAGETPAYFKARVLDRIEPRALPHWKRAWLLSTAAATVCLVLLVILMRGGGHPSPQSIATNGGPTDSVRHVAQPLTHVAAGPPQAVSAPR